MTHATGHCSRLDREGITNPIKFGSERYSKEELIAELGAAFFSNEAGILDQVVFQNSAAYLQSWIGKLEDDHTLLTSAASHAQRSFDWVTGRKPDDLEPAHENIPELAEPIVSSSQAAERPTAVCGNAFGSDSKRNRDSRPSRKSDAPKRDGTSFDLQKGFNRTHSSKRKRF